jgi:hypothetical protein
MGSPAPHFHQNILFDDICEFFLLLLPLVHFLFQVGDLPAESVKPMGISRPVCDGTNKSRVWIFEGLTTGKHMDYPVIRSTNRILLLPSKLARCLEVNSKVGEVPFVVFANIFYCVDVERNCETMDG